jgi:hypothetical protein
MHGSKDWVTIVTLVPVRMKIPVIGWAEDEDIKLKDAVQTHGDRNWGAIAVLVPGRIEKQCWARWQFAFIPKIGGASGRKGSWTAEEDSKLKDVVQTHGDKNWVTIAALMPERVKSQCRHRWRSALNPSIDRVNRLENEDITLKDAVQRHSGKHCSAISALVPCRTEKQCWARWQFFLESWTWG